MTLRHRSLLRAGGRGDVHRDRLPLALLESQHAQHAPRRVPGKYRDPDVDWIQSARPLDDEADAERNDDLRDDRDIKRALGVAGALKPAGVREGNGDEETGERQDPQQLNTQVH